MAIEIDQGLSLTDCNDFPQAGASGRLWLINEDRWDKATLTEGANDEITAITTNIGIGDYFAYRIECGNGSIQTGHAFSKNAGMSGLTHLVTAFFPDLSMAMKNSLASTFNRKRVKCIVETGAPKLAAPAEGNSAPYLLFGKHSSLEVSAVNQNLGDQNTTNGILITLSTPPGVQLEPNFPVNVQMTTTAIEALETIGT